MLSFPAAIKVYLCTMPCDMRCSFDGLSMTAEYIMQCNSFSGHLLVFCNRRSDRVKILHWDRDGGRFGTSGWRRACFSFRSPRRYGRRSRPGNWGFYWEELI
jgi:transposase